MVTRCIDIGISNVWVPFALLLNSEHGVLGQVRAGALLFGYVSSDTCVLCYWPVVKGSIVLLVSTLWIVHRLGRRVLGLGNGREVGREKGMVVVRVKGPCPLP